MSTWIAAFVAVAAIAATYFLCVRPAMRGRCAMSGTTGADPVTDRQIAELREELRMLRAQDALDDGRVARSHPTPPTGTRTRRDTGSATRPRGDDTRAA